MDVDSLLGAAGWAIFVFQGFTMDTPVAVCPVTLQRFRLTISFAYGPKIITFHKSLQEVFGWVINAGTRPTHVLIDYLAAEADNGNPEEA